MAEQKERYTTVRHGGRGLYIGALFCLFLAGALFAFGAAVFLLGGSFLWGVLFGSAAFFFFVWALWLIWIFVRAFEEMKKIFERAETIIANLADGLVEIDASRRILRVNRRAEELLSFRSERVVGVLPSFGTALKTKDSIFGFLAAVVGEAGAPSDPLPRESLSREIVVGQAPRELFLWVSFIPLSGKDGVSLGGIFIVRDSTREKVIGRLKSEFISIAAHQLRTPLSGVKWALRLFLDGDFGDPTPKQRDFLEKAYGTNERMILLVNDLLNASRIEEGRFGYAFQEGDVVQFFKAIVGELLPRMQDRGLRCIFEEKVLPRAVFDPEKLRLAFTNVLDNAIEYTPSGGTIKIVFDVMSPYVRVAVHDTGVGIPSHQLERLFTKFFRGDNVVRLQTEGTGLGLFIVKNIILAHGGDVWVDSEVGRGTTVFITIPTDHALIPSIPPVGEFPMGG
ncbi:MAG: ATP-binding protein [bacterium]|nr:ATP-binding protein [bacterium]